MNDWEELYEGYVRHLAARGFSFSTRRAYGNALGDLMEFLEGRGVGDLKAVGKEELRAFEMWLLGRVSPHTGRPWSVATRAIHIRAVKMFFQWMEATGKVLADPSFILREPKKVKPLPRAMTEEQVERLLAAPDTRTKDGARARAILEMFYSTGLRLSEMEHLTLEDVSLEEGWVRVNQGKGKKDRVVPLGPKACGVLRGYLANVRPLYCVNEKGAKPLWISKDGIPLSGQMLRLIVKRYAREAGLPRGVTTHVLRHSFATHLVKHGAPVEAVSAMLGHSRLRTTQVYTQVTPVDLKQTHEATHPREKDNDLKEVAV